MDKFLKIVGVVVVAWLALGLVGWVFGFLANAVFWVALIAGGVWVVSAVTGRNKSAVGGGRQYSNLR